MPTDRRDVGLACFLDRCEGVASSLVLLDREGISERVIGHRFLPPGIASVAAE